MTSLIYKYYLILKWIPKQIVFINWATIDKLDQINPRRKRIVLSKYHMILKWIFKQIIINWVSIYPTRSDQSHYTIWINENTV
jgi:hypothetical protein